MNNVIRLFSGPCPSDPPPRGGGTPGPLPLNDRDFITPIVRESGGVRRPPPSVPSGRKCPQAAPCLQRRPPSPATGARDVVSAADKTLWRPREPGAGQRMRRSASSASCSRSIPPRRDSRRSSPGSRPERKSSARIPPRPPDRRPRVAQTQRARQPWSQAAGSAAIMSSGSGGAWMRKNQWK